MAVDPETTKHIGNAVRAALAGSNAVSSGDYTTLIGPALNIAANYTDNPYAKAGLTSAGYVVGNTLPYFNPVGLAWNLPGLIDGISKIFDQGKMIRRAKRTRDAGILASKIVNPLTQGLGQEQWDTIVSDDSRVGDAIQRMLHHNLSGVWNSQTAHKWIPDQTLLPLYDMLTSQGYGRSEPTLNDVGGVGEIVAGGGPRYAGMQGVNEMQDFSQGKPAPNYDFYSPGVARDEGGQMENVGTYNALPAVQQGAVGFSQVLHAIQDALLRSPTPSWSPEIMGYQRTIDKQPYRQDDSY